MHVTSGRERPLSTDGYDVTSWSVLSPGNAGVSVHEGRPNGG